VQGHYRAAICRLFQPQGPKGAGGEEQRRGHISQFYYSRLQMIALPASAPHIRTMYAAVRVAQSNQAFMALGSAIANSEICPITLYARL
jgi:hypothetical protein